MREPVAELSTLQQVSKRSFDLLFACAVLLASAPFIMLAVLAATFDTRQWGIFSQWRIGRDGQPFKLYKVRTMRASTQITTNVTTSRDSRITALGHWLRRTKIDELPQFFNVLLGQMSVVGPRPDVPGYADCLPSPDRIMLQLRPGVTGPASIFFKDEAELLASQQDPERYNDEHLWPAKVRINVAYLRQYSLCEDIRLILDTAIPGLRLSRAAKARAGLIVAEEFQDLLKTPTSVTPPPCPSSTSPLAKRR